MLGNIPNYKEKYQKIQKVAEGSYGVIHKVKSKQTDEMFALKKFKNTQDQGIPSSAIREICILKNIDSQYILKPIDIYIKENTLQMVTEWRQTPLSKLIASTTPINVKQVMKEILLGMDSVHSNFVIHRDLKPSNIVLNYSQNINLKIIDFGMAKQDTWEQNPCWTNEVGTFCYRAPQLLIGKTKYNQEIDMWAIGCIFYELLTRKILFKGQDQTAIFKKILSMTVNKDICEETLASWGFNLNIGNMEFDDWKQISQKIPDNENPKESLSLLKGLLHLDGKKRINCRDALHHAYFL